MEKLLWDITLQKLIKLNSIFAQAKTVYAPAFIYNIKKKLLFLFQEISKIANIYLDISKYHLFIIFILKL